MDQTLNSGTFLICLTDGQIFQVTRLAHESTISRTTRKGEVKTDTIQWAGETYEGTAGDKYRVATREDLDRDELAKMLIDELLAQPDTIVKFKGYHENKDLPFQQGQEIVIPKGTPVHSMKRGHFVTARKQTIRVNHFGCGQSFGIGYFHDGQRIAGTHHNRSDIPVLEALYGTADLDVLIHHPDAVIRERTIFIPTQNPTVVWPGTGGYWCEVDINLLLEANGVQP
jgi:hypothetical protein